MVKAEEEEASPHQGDVFRWHLQRGNRHFTHFFEASDREFGGELFDEVFEEELEAGNQIARLVGARLHCKVLEQLFLFFFIPSFGDIGGLLLGAQGLEESILEDAADDLLGGPFVIGVGALFDH